MLTLIKQELLPLVLTFLNTKTRVLYGTLESHFTLSLVQVVNTYPSYTQTLYCITNEPQQL